MPSDPSSSSSTPATDLSQQVAYYQQRLDELTGQSLKADAVISRTSRELKQRRQGFALLSELHRAISTDQTPAQMYALAIGSVQRALKMDRTVVLEVVRPASSTSFSDGACPAPVGGPRSPINAGQAPSLNAGASPGSADGVVRFRPTIWAGVDDAAAKALKTVEIAVHADWLKSDASLLATKSAPVTPMMAEWREKVGVPYFVCVPVWCEGQAAALLLSGRMREAKPFFPPMDDGDINTLQSLAGFLGGALHNARLFAHQKRMAASFARFVPQQFLEFLGRDSIVDVQLGDQTQRQMTILFSDIRSFTTISEKMSPKENFDFINHYLEYAGPVIRANHGFIDKYIGDAIMALFPDDADNAVAGAVGLLRSVERFNAERARQAVGRSIAIGAGLHTGLLMLGTIGFAERMESTVISDSVNLASRMEGLTKMYGAGVVISGSTLEAMRNPQAFAMRRVDRVKVKGKRDPVDVFEIIDAESADRAALKRRTRAIFDEAFTAYSAGEMGRGAELFRQVLAIQLDDHAASLLLQRCDHYLAAGVPADWVGVETLDHK